MGKYQHITDPVHAAVTAFMTSYGNGSNYHPNSDSGYYSRTATHYVEMNDYDGKKRFSFVKEIDEYYQTKYDYDYIRITPIDVLKAIKICLQNDIPIYATYEYGSWFCVTGRFNSNDKSMYRVYNIDKIVNHFI